VNRFGVRERIILASPSVTTSSSSSMAGPLRSIRSSASSPNLQSFCRARPQPSPNQENAREPRWPRSAASMAYPPNLVSKWFCPMGNLSAGAASGRCPTDNIFIFADAAYCEGDAAIRAVTRTDQMNRTEFLRRLMHGLSPFLGVMRSPSLSGGLPTRLPRPPLCQSR
jgi:hypothetical protein